MDEVQESREFNDPHKWSTDENRWLTRTWKGREFTIYPSASGFKAKIEKLGSQTGDPSDMRNTTDECVSEEAAKKAAFELAKRLDEQATARIAIETQVWVNDDI